MAIGLWLGLWLGLGPGLGLVAKAILISTLVGAGMSSPQASLEEIIGLGPGPGPGLGLGLDSLCNVINAHTHTQVLLVRAHPLTGRPRPAWRR